MFETIVCVDTSYIVYHILFSAFKKWQEESPNADILEDNNIEKSDITIYFDFMEILNGKIYDTFNNITNIINSFNSLYGNRVHNKILCALDPIAESKLKSWRYLFYKDYKGQRASLRNKYQFDVRKVFNTVIDYLITNNKLQQHYNVDFVYVDGCEADDIIAVYLSDDSVKHYKKLLIASDKDYLQLHNVTQITLENKEVMIEQPYPELITITPDTYLLAKIITGDDSDNIPHVFPKVAYKTAIKKYVSNIEFLNESLNNDIVAKSRFKLNNKLISFKEIPNSIISIIKSTLGI